MISGDNTKPAYLAQPKIRKVRKAFTLTQSVNNFTFALPLPFKVKKIRFNVVAYTTQDNNASNFLTLNISNMPGGQFQNGGFLSEYSIYVPLNSQAQSLNVYINKFEGSWDAESDEGVAIQNLNIACYINGQTTILVSPSSPVFIELLLSE